MNESVHRQPPKTEMARKPELYRLMLLLLMTIVLGCSCQSSEAHSHEEPYCQTLPLTVALLEFERCTLEIENLETSHFLNKSLDEIEAAVNSSDLSRPAQDKINHHMRLMRQMVNEQGVAIRQVLPEVNLDFMASISYPAVGNQIFVRHTDDLQMLEVVYHELLHLIEQENWPLLPFVKDTIPQGRYCLDGKIGEYQVRYYEYLVRSVLPNPSSREGTSINPVSADVNLVGVAKFLDTKGLDSNSPVWFYFNDLARYFIISDRPSNSSISDHLLAQLGDKKRDDMVSLDVMYQLATEELSGLMHTYPLSQDDLMIIHQAHQLGYISTRAFDQSAKFFPHLKTLASRAILNRHTETAHTYNNYHTLRTTDGRRLKAAVVARFVPTHDYRKWHRQERPVF